MSIQTPSPDAIFKKWVNRLEGKRLEKLFKTKKESVDKKLISAAEYVRDVKKFALFTVLVEVKEEAKRKNVEKPVLAIKGETFYDHATEKKVPVYKTLKVVSCRDCNGKGYFTCEDCGGKGQIVCNKCSGGGKVKCSQCKGATKIKVEIKIVVAKEKTKKATIDANCPNCHGSGKEICGKCKGLGKLYCKTCNGSGKIKCDTCGGTGRIVKYEIGPIIDKPKTVLQAYFVKDLDKAVKKELEKNIGEADSFIVKINDLKEETVEKKLGFMNKDIKKTMEKIKKQIKEIRKDKSKEIKEGIKVYPVILLEIDTPKKRGIKILGIGSREKNIVVEL